MNYDLSDKQVRKIVGSYHNPATTDEIYSFGQRLLAEETARTAVLESKATATAGYTSAVLAFVFSKLSTPPHTVSWIIVLTAVIAVTSGLGIVLALCALRITRTSAVSDKEWLSNSDGLDENVDLRKRYYVVVMHDILKEDAHRNMLKAELVQWAQALLGAAGTLTAVLIVLQLLQN